jgi:aminopeptidase N
MAVTQFETTGARRAFPCFDEPAWKANFTLHIAHAPEHNVLANMPMNNDEPL